MSASYRRFGLYPNLEKAVQLISVWVFLYHWGGKRNHMIINLTDNKIIVKNVIIANNFLKRLKGLMFTRELPSNSSMYISPCDQIHTFFMNYNIDVLYVNKENTILAIDENMKPGKIGKKIKGAAAVVELRAGKIKESNIKIGQALQIFK